MRTKGRILLGPRPYPWHSIALLFGAGLLIAAIGGKFGWLAVGTAFTLTAWAGLLLAALHARTKPEATRSRGHLIVRPPGLMRHGVPLLLCGPWLVVFPFASARYPWFWGVSAFSVGVAALIVAAFQRRIRLIDGGFEEIRLTGRAVLVAWTSVKSVRYNAKYRWLLLVVRRPGRRDRIVLFPSAWDGAATLAAAALAAIPEDALRPATQEHLALAQLAALSTIPPA